MKAESGKRKAEISRRWNRRHRARYNALQRHNNAKRQEFTKIYAVANSDAWTFAHDFAALVLPHLKAALLTGRTYAAVANRVRKLQ